MKFLKLLPVTIRFWVYAGLVFSALGLLFVVYCKIEKIGHDRCEARHVAASIELKDKARKEIIEVERKYEKIETKIDQVEAPDDVVGYRTELAIDSLPDPSNR